MPASFVTSSGAALATCFAPEEHCAAFAVRAIDNAEHEILVGAYGLTTGPGIVEALIRAEQRGVDVWLIADKTTPCTRGSGIGALAAGGVPIWIDDQPRIAHAKTMVIDGVGTLMGSYNWTMGAAQNSEDLNLVSSPTVAAADAAHWRERLAVSVSFDRRELVLELTSRLARLFWEALDRADYAVTLVRCWAVDHVYGPEPLTAADKQREAEHGRLRQAFPMIGLDGPIGLQAKPLPDSETSSVVQPPVPASNTSRPEVPAPRVID